MFVEGNAELTPARLVGQFDPSQVLAEGYRAEHFVDGPLLTAMREGGLLYLEELNRVPEETLNVLITVLTEGEIAVPAAGHGAGRAGLPADRGDEPVRRGGHGAGDQAIADRMCRVVLGYQDERGRAGDHVAVSGLDGRLVELVGRR